MADKLPSSKSEHWCMSQNYGNLWMLKEVFDGNQLFLGAQNLKNWRNW